MKNHKADYPSKHETRTKCGFNPLTAGAVYIHFFCIFYKHITYQLLTLLKIKSDINQQGLAFLDSILSNLNNFHSFEVMDRVSKTQLQVGENFN